MDFIHSIPNISWCLIGFEFSRYRPFVVMPIPNSNLILLVKDKNCPPGAEDRYYRMTVESEEYKYDTSCSSETTPCLTCFKANNRKLFRRRPASCISQNKNVRSISLFKWVVCIYLLYVFLSCQESEIQQCGHGNTISISLILLVLAMFIGQIL